MIGTEIEQINVVVLYVNDDDFIKNTLLAIRSLIVPMA